MTKTLSPVALLLFACSGFAAEYGPIFQWHNNPCTTVDVHWIATVSDKSSGTNGKWFTGKAGFGYGDDDDQTVFEDMQGNFRSVYIRRAYEIPEDVADGSELVLSLRYDDAFVAYLNGKEVARQGVVGSGSEVRDLVGHEADVWEDFTLGTVKPGQKGVIAIEGHNDKLESSDFTLRPRLDLKTNGKGVVIVPEGAQWSYLTGPAPEGEWTKASGSTNESPQVPLYEAAYRPALKSPEDKGAKWMRMAASARAFGPTEHQVHSVGLVGLEPGTRYEFKIARRGSLLGTWQFETAPAQFEEGMVFVEGGDMFHDRPSLDAMNGRAGKENPLFALLGGDLAYANGANSERWLEWLQSWSECAVAPDGRAIPMILAIGNHEVQGVAYRPTNAPGRGAAPFFYSLFSGQENGARTTTDFGDYLSVLTLDSGHTENLDTQTEWLEANLAARADIPRLFVCYHRPAWSTGVKADAVDIRNQWSPLFEKYKVDAVFEHDHHLYKRTHPIREGDIDEENGVIYLGDGAWGVQVRPVPPDWKERRPWLAEAQSLNHLIKVTLTKEGFQYEAMKVNGEIFDATKRPRRR